MYNILYFYYEFKTKIMKTKLIVETSNLSVEVNDWIDKHIEINEIIDIQYRQNILTIYRDTPILAWRKPIGERIGRSALILYK